MTTLAIKDADGVTRYLECTGAGTSGDPFNPVQEISQATHDNLNANVTLQIADSDVANGNPVPVSDAAGSLTVDQSTHDNLNANANMQIANSDVGTSNPVPVQEQKNSSLNYKYTALSNPTSGSGVTNDPSAGEYIQVAKIVISTDAAVTISLKDESGTTVAAFYADAKDTIEVGSPGGWKLPTADEKLTLHTSGTANVAVTVWYESVT